jgi:tRNA G10  N-methylase Trm11
MDDEWGLPSLEDKRFRLCLTDPPYGKKKQHKGRYVGKVN